jgi:hypothetical protein
VDLINSGGSSKNGNRSNDKVPLDKIFQEAFKRRQSIARIGLRFGGTLVNVQAERLRERSSNSEIAKQLTLSGADTLDSVVEAISNLDSTLSKQR